MSYNHKQNIAEIRRKLTLKLLKEKLSQRDIAERLGVSRSCIAKIVATEKKKLTYEAVLPAAISPA